MELAELLISINEVQRNGLTISIPATCLPWLRSSVSKRLASLASAAARIIPSQKKSCQTSQISDSADQDSRTKSGSRALEAVSRWRFQPGMKDGRAVTWENTNLQINFSLGKPKSGIGNNTNLSDSEITTAIAVGMRYKNPDTVWAKEFEKTNRLKMSSYWGGSGSKYVSVITDYALIAMASAEAAHEMRDFGLVPKSETNS